MGLKQKFINSKLIKNWIKKYYINEETPEINNIVFEETNTDNRVHSGILGKYILGENSSVHHFTEIYNYSNDPNAITIGKNSNIAGKILNYPLSGQVKIGDYCFFGKGSNIFAAKSVIIGNNVLIAHNVDIFDNDTHPIDPIERQVHYKAIVTGEHLTKDFDLNQAPIKICNNAWIGAKSTILKGVTIGEAAIVATGSVVTKDVEPYTIVAGNPARKIKEISR